MEWSNVSDINIIQLRVAARFGPIVVNQPREGKLGYPQTLEWLWDAVAIFSGNDWLYVWWIPTGPLTKFPLHAAGYHNRAVSATVLDRVMSSYSSSIKAIIYGRRRCNLGALSASTRALLIAMQDTPGTTNSLSFATAEVEAVGSIYKSMGINTVEPDRCKQAVASQLPHCRLFHFAGHEHTNTVNPSQSKLLLEDWKSKPLTVAGLLDMNLRENSPFLAYLSACGTGQIRDERFTDESIHLISACQLAGFGHVIGTMWEANDELCVEMARITYEKMREKGREKGVTDESVCVGLHCASRELRDRWTWPARRKVRSPTCTDLIEDEEDGMGRAHWIPYVHVGV
ncbi:CHAT domain-containing protein [Trichoderma evansii]